MEKADLEAPERNKPLLLCQRCFAVILDGAEYCAECGAPVVDDFSEGTDSSVYPELARANLLRMRGEYRMAEDICLAILRRHPNSATANTLLGDICAERGDLKQAAEWYEMALDITPESTSDRTKLDSVRARIRDHEAAETAKQLGLPTSRPKVGLWIGSVTVFIGLIALVAYLLGERSNASRTGNVQPITAPVSVPLQSTRENTTARTDLPAKPDATSPTETPTADLLTSIREAAATEGNRIVGASRFPETMGVLLTFTVAPSESARQIAANLGFRTLEKVSDTPSVTLIALRDGKVAYLGTASREKLAVTHTDEWRSQSATNPGALADTILGNEWMPPADSPPPAATPPG